MGRNACHQWIQVKRDRHTDNQINKAALQALTARTSAFAGFGGSPQELAYIRGGYSPNGAPASPSSYWYVAAPIGRWEFPALGSRVSHFDSWNVTEWNSGTSKPRPEEDDQFCFPFLEDSRHSGNILPCQREKETDTNQRQKQRRWERTHTQTQEDRQRAKSKVISEVVESAALHGHWLSLEGTDQRSLHLGPKRPLEMMQCCHLRPLNFGAFCYTAIANWTPAQNYSGSRAKLRLRGGVLELHGSKTNELAGGEPGVDLDVLKNHRCG